MKDAQCVFSRLGASGAAALVAVALVFFLTSAAAGQTPASQPVGLPAGEIEKALDQPVEAMTLHNALLVDVIAKLGGDRTKWLELPAATLNLLPYGDETPVSVRVPGGRDKTTRRMLIGALLDPLCLTTRLVADDADGRSVLRIVPRAELIRVGRRATIGEMDLLYQLRTLRVVPGKTALLTAVQEAAGRPVTIQFDLTGLDPAAAYRQFNATLPQLPPGAPAKLLDAFCLAGRNRAGGAGAWTWRVEDDTIRVVDQTKQVLHQLGRHVTIRWTELPLDQALMQLCRLAGVEARFQPGMFAGMDPASQRITWTAPDETISQTLDALAGKLGISYEVRDDAVAFFGPRRQDPVVGQVTMGTRSGKFTYQLFIRRSMLPKDAQAAVDQELKIAVDAMARELTGTGSANPPVGPK